MDYRFLGYLPRDYDFCGCTPMTEHRFFTSLWFTSFYEPTVFVFTYLTPTGKIPKNPKEMFFYGKASPLEIRKCDSCGRYGAPKQIVNTYINAEASIYSKEKKTLCRTCAGRHYAVDRKIKHMEETAQKVRELKTTIQKERKKNENR